VGVGLVCSDCEASVQHEDATVCPGSEETSAVRWWLECGIVLLEGDVHVLEGGWRRSWGTNGEGQSVSLVIIVIGILANDDDFDIAEGSMARPRTEELDIPKAAND
jgi:hypothetical protein